MSLSTDNKTITEFPNISNADILKVLTRLEVGNSERVKFTPQQRAFFVSFYRYCSENAVFNSERGFMVSDSMKRLSVKLGFSVKTIDHAFSSLVKCNVIDRVPTLIEHESSESTILRNKAYDTYINLALFV